MSGINRIDSTPARISTNFTVGKQTQQSSFGEKMQDNLGRAGSALANGAALVGGQLPGGALISAAVSSVTSLGGGSPSSSATYAATGAMPVGGGGNNTTVGAGGAVGGGASTGGPNLTQGGTSGNVGTMNNEVAQMSSENMKMMQVQIQMQRENQVFSSVSNVLKTKHDTVKNSISNIR